MIDEYILINGCRIYFNSKLWDRVKLKNQITDLYINGKMGQIRKYYEDDIKNKNIKIVNVP